jgi:Fur family transcriptional regulator, ferric uptake regulator
MVRWEECLSEAGYRITASRRAVAEVLIRDSAPLSPQEILEQAQAVHANLGLVTVYRTLNLLTDLDLVRRIHREDGCHGYVLASPGHHHAVVCHSCGRAVEFTGKNDIDALIVQVEARTGYRVDDHLLQLSGLCPNCQET